MSDGDSGRKRILDSAAFILRTKGFGAARLSEIAQGAGMLAPSIYHHFKSKDEVVEEVMLSGIYRNTRHIVAKVEVLGPETAPVDRLRAAIVAHVEFLLSGDDYSSAVARSFGDLPSEMKQRVLAAYATFDSYWRDLLVAASPSGNDAQTTVARKFLIAMLDSCPSWYRAGRLGPTQIANQAADLFLGGFAP
ncbi:MULTISPECIES: TetR/AcrR family transcriptional regulator [Sphingomonadaceae]|jgi:AcrR family transcriptional regulator|uniref:Regulatory protein TetR n=1 Tax=Novosphingobium resinovorum TaxID=158500 RepID=A0A031J8H8_9SPHN|nr:MULTISPECIES: TetR/AcrR family transcriptional regulator [Sphingomonadaceae]AOR76018.1 TetR family transcriptional regulator [Novosphingobium resinovorum]EJU09858.1 regulatory protein TetR [Sphingomonas sp. LH128]EZP70479.1 Regulatory protein TetR [Novosphingobium resinovorum]MBF7011399.1 TetR/AcrR family transcriptional regulator [Novosphingobium sp. HR1a]MEE4452212.1 TetR/AcrR family transcriptional regulator [Novosphingobium resinovorum]